MRSSRYAAILAGLFLSACSGPEPQPETSQPTDAPSELVLSNVTVIDGRGGTPLAGHTLVIRDGRIAKVTAADRARPTDGATVLDLSGHYVIPGLVDSHVHLPADPQELEGFLGFLFDGGITTVRDMGGDAVLFARVAPRSRTGASLLPRLYYSAYWAGNSFWDDRRWEGYTQDREPGEVPWALAITDSTDLASAVRDAKAIGVTGIKIYSDLSPELVGDITAEAHRQGLRVWSHATVFPVRPADVVKAGVDAISHSALFVWEGADVLPTRFHVNPFTDFGPVGPYPSVPPEAPAIVRVLEQMRSRGIILDATLSTIAHSISPQAAEWSIRLTAMAKEMGVVIAVGTDRDDRATPDGYPTLFEEMEMLVERCGFTPLEALTAATWNGALALGTEELFGIVEPGKLADLVVLRSDPTADIRNARQVVYVIKEGNVHRASGGAR